MDPIGRDIERDCGLARGEHRMLISRLSDLIDEDSLDSATGSRLPGWTCGHVLSHLARNADGHRRMIKGAGRGEIVEQYVGGVAGRTREIEQGAERGIATIIEDLSASTDALEQAWAATDWAGRGRRTLGGETPIDRLPFLRLREVSLHTVDLDIGVELADLDPTYVRLELRRMEMLWTARQPMGMTPLPERALALSPSDRLGWLTGRLDVEALHPADIF